MDRKVPYSDDHVAVIVQAGHGHLAARLADEVAYAVAWHRGAFKGSKRKPSRPEPWAIKATSPRGVHAEIRHIIP